MAERSQHHPPGESLPRKCFMALRGVSVLARRFRINPACPDVEISTIRGVWGAALRELDPYVYRAVFSPQDYGDQSLVPRYLIRAAYSEGEGELDYLLFSSGIAHDIALWRAWDRAGGMGLGRSRERFVIEELQQLQPDNEEVPLSNPFQTPGGDPLTGWSLADVPWPILGDPETTPCCLDFPLPLRLKGGAAGPGTLVEQPTLADLLVGICRRLEALHQDRHALDWQDLQKQLVEVSTKRESYWQGRPMDMIRYSGRQKEEISLQGIVGHLILPEGPGPVWPLLAAASWIHIGKGTAYGLGACMILPDEDELF